MERARRFGQLRGEKRFVRLISAAGVSSIGDGMLFVALPLVARTVTTSDRSIAAILAVSRLPLLLLSFGGAAIADRSDARKTMVVADLVRAAVLLALAVAVVTDSLTLAAIYVTAFALGLFEIPFAAASQRMIPSTVPDALLGRANARMSLATTSGEQFVGPAISGQLLALGSSAPLLGDAASFLASASFLRRLPPMPPEKTGDERRPIRADIADGLRWFRSNRTIRVATALVGSLALAQAMVNALLVQLGAETLHLTGRSIGYFITAIALGNLTGTLFAERVLDRLGYASCLLLMAIFAGIGYGGIGFTNNTLSVVALMMLEGVVVVFGQVAFNVLRQRLIPRHMIGRVYTTTRIFIRGAAPAGALLGGEIAQRHGPPAAILSAGVISIVAAIALGPSLVTALRDVKP